MNHDWTILESWRPENAVMKEVLGDYLDAIDSGPISAEQII